MLARFLPRDERFFDLFAEAAANALASATTLAEIIERGPETERKVRRLRDLEHHGDELTHRVFQALNTTFVTPLDREDIRAIAAEIDDFVDDIEETGKRLWLYRLEESTDHARLFARLLVEQAQVMDRGVPHLERAAKEADKLRDCVLELHRLENEADDALNLALAGLYDGVTEIPALIRALRWGELYGLLEDATDRGEDIGNSFDAIMLKYA